MKVMYLAGALALMATIGCTNQSEDRKVVEKETVREVEVPARTETANTPDRTVEVEKESETSVKIGKSGGSFKNKDVDIDVDR